MARRVYFAFHYQRDIWRVNTVRNSWVTQDRQVAGFYDASLWEEAKTKGAEAIKKMIDEGMKGSSVTAVLIGLETANRRWVKYEIEQSYNLGKGLLGVYIHNIENYQGQTDTQGSNPFDYFYIEQNGRRIYFSDLYKTYNWKIDNGYKNFGTWVEQAANNAGKSFGY